MNGNIRSFLIIGLTMTALLPLACKPLPNSTGQSSAGTAAAVPANQPTPNTPDQVLDQLLGTWDCNATVWEGANAPARNLTTRSTFTRILGGKFVQETCQDSDNNSSMTLFCYDPSRQYYRSQFFGSSIGAPNPTTGTWNETARTLDWSAPGDYPTTIRHRFISDNAWEATCVVKDSAGNTVFRGEYKVTRAKDQSPVVLSEAGATGGPLPTELKVLDQLLGTWRQETIIRRAKWSPEAKQATGTYTFRRILGGRYVLETGEDALGSALLLYTYDSKRGCYLGWVFNSNSGGPYAPASARWNEARHVLEFFEFPEKDGHNRSSEMRFMDNGTIVSTYGVKDAAGETLCDIEFKMTRADGDAHAANNQNRKDTVTSTTYKLVSIDGQTVPCSPMHDGQRVPEVSGGVMTINSDGTFAGGLEFTDPHIVAPSGAPGTFTRESNTLTMKHPGAGYTKATIDGDKFTMDNEGMLFVYQK